MKAITAFLVFLVILTLPFLVSAASGDMFNTPKPELQLPVSGECVKDTAWMRANHMNLLEKERAIAVRTGVRTKEHSLDNCFECHTDKTKFCDVCHKYAGVKPGCFTNVGGCHHPGPTSE